MKRLLTNTGGRGSSQACVCTALGPSSLTRSECLTQVPSAWCWRASCALGEPGRDLWCSKGSRERKLQTQALREDLGFACGPAQRGLSVYHGGSGPLWDSPGAQGEEG